MLPPRVLVVPKDMDIAPTITEIDIKGIAMHLTSRFMDKDVAYAPVFLGCGCAQHEVALCKELRAMGYKLHNEMFIDKIVTTATISNIAVYTETMHKDYDPRPILVLSFTDLHSHMLVLSKNYPQIKFIVIGIHAAQIFKLKGELYEFHSFLCTCARLSRQGAVQAEYLNYLCKSSISKDILSHTEECAPGSDTWVYHRCWWEHACDGITCTGAAQLLQEST
jgi:hypothetical protein